MNKQVIRFTFPVTMIIMKKLNLSLKFHSSKRLSSIHMVIYFPDAVVLTFSNRSQKKARENIQEPIKATPNY